MRLMLELRKFSVVSILDAVRTANIRQISEGKCQESEERETADVRWGCACGAEISMKKPMACLLYEAPLALLRR